LDHADWQWITTEYQTGVEEGTGSRSSWRVVATDLSCLRVTTMMMMSLFFTRIYGKFRHLRYVSRLLNSMRHLHFVSRAARTTAIDADLGFAVRINDELTGM